MGVFDFTTCAQNGYFIKIQELVLDFEIAEKLGISLQEYINILKQFNAYQEKCGEYFFSELKDVKKCVNYLNKKYGVMLKLIE